MLLLAPLKIRGCSAGLIKLVIVLFTDEAVSTLVRG